MASYNSFYGGRRGASFVIVKSYLDIPTMVNDFNGGNNFEDVHFDEYVIINNPNKNHPDNGKLFRRGHDYNSDRRIQGYETYDRSVEDGDIGNENPLINLTTAQYEGYVNIGSEAEPNYVLTPYVDNGYDIPYPYKFVKNTQIVAHGAEFIGTIIGPEGKAPHFILNGYNAVNQYVTTHSADAGVENNIQRGSYGPNRPGDLPGEGENLNNHTDSLVAGKEVQSDGNGTSQTVFNDRIEWVSASMRDALGNNTEAMIGLKIPYLVTDMYTVAVEPYELETSGANEGKQVYKDTSYIKHRTPQDNPQDENDSDIAYDNGHPFYNDWIIGIPKGVKGESISDIRITTFNEFLESYADSQNQAAPLYKLIKKERTKEDSTVETYYESEEWDYINEIKIILNIPTQSQLTTEQDNLLYDFNHNIKIIVCTTVNYDTYKDGQKKDYFLGYFTQLKSLQYNRDAVNSDGNNEPIGDGKLRNDENEIIGDGKLRLFFTGLDGDNKSSKEFDFDFVNSVDLKEDGTVVFKRASKNKESLNQKIKWIKAVELRPSQYEIYVPDDSVNFGYEESNGFLNEVQLQSYITNVNPLCVYTVAEGDEENPGNHYYIQTISSGIPKKFKESLLIINKADGTQEIRGDIINNIHPWNTVDANFDSVFDDSDNPLEIYQLGIKYNTKVDKNGTMVQQEYRTTIPFVTSLFYNEENANFYYRTSLNDQMDILLGQFVQIKDIKLDEEGNLYTIVNAIPNQLLEKGETEGHYQIRNISNDENDNYSVENRLLNGNLNIIKDFRIVNENNVSEEIAEITDGLQQPYSEEIQEKINEINNKLNKLEVIYTNGESQVISENPMYFLSAFEYDQENNQLRYQFNGTDHEVDLPIVTWVGYNKETGQIEFKTGNNEGDENDEASQVISGGDVIPFIRRIGYNNTTKDLFVQFNQNIIDPSQIEEGEETNAVTVDDVIAVISGEDNTLENDGWIKIGNMATYPMTPLPFTNYTYSNLYDLLISSENYDSETPLAQNLDRIVREGPDVVNFAEEDANFTKNIVINVLNAIFNDGIIHYAFSEEDSTVLLPDEELINFRGYAVTIGNPEDQKDFYVFDWGKKNGTTSSESESNSEEMTSGSWYYLGTIERGGTDIHIVDSAESTTNTYGQGHLGFIYQDEVCEINQSINFQANLPNNFNFKFSITRLQRSKGYINYLNNIPVDTQIAIRPKNNDGSYTEDIYYLDYTSSTQFPYTFEDVTLGSEFANIIFTKEQGNNIKLQITAIGCDLDIEVGTNYS